MAHTRGVTALTVLVLALLAECSAQGVYTAHTRDGAGISLNCPPGTTVRLVQASYSRNDSGTCMDGGRTVTSRSSSTDALLRVAPLCDGRQNCRVMASDGEFRTPANCTTTTLQLSYVCVKTVSVALLCEGSGNLDISCPVGSVLEIRSAFYGRDDLTTCPHREDTTKTVGCSANNTLPIVNNTCSGLQECRLAARSAIFGNPCPGTFKYLKVGYSCVECINLHPRSQECEQWSLEGQCSTNPVWMKLNCRKSCYGCGLSTPPCRNIMKDADCDFWAGKGDCENGTYVSEMMVNCRASCLNCKNYGTCQNIWPSSGNYSCVAREANGECWKNAKFMLVNCAGSCLCPANRQRDIATVQCVNHWKGENGTSTVEQVNMQCNEWVSMGSCTTNVGFMYRNCFRACTNCTEPPRCRNVMDDNSCDGFKYSGECTDNPLWMFSNCYKACTGCQLRECVNKHTGKNRHQSNDAECEYWRGLGRCQEEPKFMMKQCWKTCSRCAPKPVIAECKNDYGDDAACDRFRDAKDCTKNPHWMITYCRKSCSYCSYPYLQYARLGPSPFFGESTIMTRGQTFILPESFKEDGTLSHFTAFFINDNRVSLETWRPLGLQRFRRISNVFVNPTTNGPMTVPVTNCVEVHAGDRIGFSSINNKPLPITYRFNLTMTLKNTYFRTAFSKNKFNAMKLPYYFSLAGVYDNTKKNC